MLGVTKRTLYNWKNQSEQSGTKHIPVLRPVTAPNGRKYYREDEIITALSQCWGIQVTPAELHNGQALANA
jgi:transposase